MTFIIVLLYALAAAAGLDKNWDLCRSLALLASMLLVVAVILWLAKHREDDGEERRSPYYRDPPGPGPDIIIYPEPPEESPRLHGPSGGHWAERGAMREEPVHHALPPMRREPAPVAPVEVPKPQVAPRPEEQPIYVPNWPVKAPKER